MKKITKRLWEEWRKKAKGEKTRYNYLVKKLMEKFPNEQPPEEFISLQEFRVLLALNSHEMTITDIYRRTTMGYPDVYRTVHELAEKGLIEIIGKKKHRMGKYCRITQEGIKRLLEWQRFHTAKF